MGNEVVKRVARDGTQRGLTRKGTKNKRTLLMEACQTEVERWTGIKDWDPVVMMAVVAARAFAGYPAVDENGRAIVDEDGNQVMVPPNPELATAAAVKVAPYLHSQLRPKDDETDKGDNDDEGETRDRVYTAFENMGIKVVRPPEEGDDE